MCLLTFLPAGVMPDIAALRQGTELNRDGFGFAIVSEGTLIVRRGLNAEEMLDKFATMREVHPDGPALFHSRLTTHGQTSLLNTHPFFVGNDPLTVIAHNGIMPSQVRPKKGDGRSDTRIVADDFIPEKVGELTADLNRLYLEKWITPANKMVILSANPYMPEQAYILNEDEGIWSGGAWYSNDGFRKWGIRYTRAYVRSLPKTEIIIGGSRGKAPGRIGRDGMTGRWQYDADGCGVRWTEGYDPGLVERERRPLEAGTAEYYSRWPREWTHCGDCGMPHEECDCWTIVDQQLDQQQVEAVKQATKGLHGNPE